VMIGHQTGHYPVELADRANIDLRVLYQLDQERKDEIKQGVIDQQAETQDSIKAIQEERARRIEVMRKRSFP
ncbi:hypothetical protein, partial [Neorhizobium galegae]|uniref:hypothetical protein n=1 Tax=Neorhizobium galegae TaxID=399 RepID=UPI00210768EB